MPYKTPFGTHYHLTLGCCGATISCGTDGLAPCNLCCDTGNGTSGDGDGSQSSGAGAPMPLPDGDGGGSLSAPSPDSAGSPVPSGADGSSRKSPDADSPMKQAMQKAAAAASAAKSAMTRAAQTAAAGVKGMMGGLDLPEPNKEDIVKNVKKVATWMGKAALLAGFVTLVAATIAIDHSSIGGTSRRKKGKGKMPSSNMPLPKVVTEWALAIQAVRNMLGTRPEPAQ